jgi:hypothetical protein
MKPVQRLTILLLTLFALSKPADAKQIGLGVVLGQPTAITGKYWMTNSTAVDFGLSWATSYTALIYGDYLWHYPGVFGRTSEFTRSLTGYIGVGGGLFSWSNDVRYTDRPRGWTTYSGGTGLYARIPLGAEWQAPKPPIGVFGEIAPGLALLPGLGVTVDIGLGIRFYF